MQGGRALAHLGSLEVELERSRDRERELDREKESDRQPDER